MPVLERGLEVYERHVICSRPWRRIFDIQISGHVFRDNTDFIARLSREKQCCCQACHSRPELRMVRFNYSCIHSRLMATYPITTMLASAMVGSTFVFNIGQKVNSRTPALPRLRSRVSV